MEQRVRIADIMSEVGSQKDVELSFDERELEIGEVTFLFPQRVRVEVAITNTGEGLLVQGSLLGEAKTSCSRCLVDAEVPIDIKIQEEVLSVDEIEVSDSAGLPDQYSHDGDSIDLAPMVEQALIIDLPSAPLCKTDCSGLCPICGIDRNLEQCDCETERTDPRWDALNSLKQGMNE